jgi:exoribonuclease-2
MSILAARVGSLVLYRGKPGLVQRANDKLELALPDGDTAKVRPKDVQVLHEGPLQSLRDLRTEAGDAATAWEIIAGDTVTLHELAELIYGATTPSAIWAAWQTVAEGEFFEGTPERIAAHTHAQIEQRRIARAAQRAERDAWASFVQHVSEHRFAPEDHRYLADIEALALGATDRGRALRDLGRDCVPESAHALLLDLGYWTPEVNPYPARLQVPAHSPELDVGSLPSEERRDLTHLESFAIDDPSTNTPDDAISFEGNRLWVHVADVAALVPPHSALDSEARTRGATLYLPELTATMLPESLTPILGLGLSDVSPAISFGIGLVLKQFLGVDI